MLLKEEDIQNKYEVPVMPHEKTSGKSSGNKFYDNLIKKAKELKDVPGALYVVSEALPFDEVNYNHKRVPFDKKLSQVLGNSCTNPMPKPIIYNHEDGGWSPEAPNVVGKIFSWGIQDNGRGSKSLYNAQCITDKNTIERIYTLTDYSQSITYYADTYVCDLCGAVHPQTICDHYPGDIIEDGKETSAQKPPRRVTFSLHANRVSEQSFVLKPAYDNVMLLAYEQNSSGNSGKGGIGRAVMEYSNKKSIVVPELENLNGDKLENSNSIQENNDIINKRGDEAEVTTQPSNEQENENKEQNNTKGDNSMKDLDESTINALETIIANHKNANEKQPDEKQETSNANETGNVDKLTSVVSAVLDQNKELITQNQQLTNTVVTALVGALNGEETKTEVKKEEEDNSQSTDKEDPKPEGKSEETNSDKKEDEETNDSSEETKPEENSDKDEDPTPKVVINQGVLGAAFRRNAGLTSNSKKETK